MGLPYYNFQRQPIAASLTSHESKQSLVLASDGNDDLRARALFNVIDQKDGDLAFHEGDVTTAV